MTAHVEEPAENAVRPTNHDDRLAGCQHAGDILSRDFDLVRSACELPCTLEHRATLQVPDV
jgi:hypothetical protein